MEWGPILAYSVLAIIAAGMYFGRWGFSPDDKEKYRTRTTKAQEINEFIQKQRQRAEYTYQCDACAGTGFDNWWTVTNIGLAHRCVKCHSTGFIYAEAEE